MEPLTMTPSRRLQGVRAYDRTADAFEAVAWKPPTAARFRPEIANDAPAVPEPTVGEMLRAVPGWVMILGGGIVAALMGALLGGALQI